MVKPLRGVAGEGITGLVDVQPGDGVHVVGVDAAVAVAVKVRVKGAFVGAAVGKDGEPRRRIVAGVIEVGQAVPVAVSLGLRTTVGVDLHACSGVWTGVFGVVQTVPVRVGIALFVAAALGINGGARSGIGAGVEVVLDPVFIVVKLGLRTALFVDLLAKWCVWTDQIQLVDETVTVIVVDVNHAATYPVRSVQHTGHLNALIAVHPNRVIAKAVAVFVF